MASAAVIRVEVCHAAPGGVVWLRELEVPPGTTLAQAVAASGFFEAYPDVSLEAGGAGVYGKRQPPGTLLKDGDRVEIYRPLVFDPMESRRRRAVHKSRVKY